VADIEKYAYEEDILTAIERGMSDKIGSIKKTAGYYLDWGSVNEPDVAKQVFPSAEIILENEECIDETDTAWSGAYNQEATYLIRVRASLPNEEVVPVYKINEILNKALTDLKKLFGTRYVVSDRCDTIMYRGAQRVVDGSNDIFRPAYLETRWLVKYTQVRTDPSRYI
jgi:hypothetical protein